jgi:hypothetical protein
MDLYWTHFNEIMCVVQRRAYEEDFSRRRIGYYSALLHICILAVGYRFADKTREDVKPLGRGRDALESTFYLEAKYMIESELEVPKGLSTICALLLFGDLECGLGRDNVGWMMHAMAIRITLDLRLNCKPTPDEASYEEVRLRETTFWAVLAYDRYWALFGQRPTTIKLEEVEISSDCVMKWPAASCTAKSNESMILHNAYEALLDLLSIAGEIYAQPLRTKTSQEIRLHRKSLDRQLHSWYTKLEAGLSSSLENLQTCHPCVLLLHQQYHSSKILLHWPFIEHPGTPGSSQYFAMAESRRQEVCDAIQICKDAAISIAQLYEEYMKRLDAAKLFITCVQHTVSSRLLLSPSSRRLTVINCKAIAASALIAACYLENASSDAGLQCLRHLAILQSVQRATTSTYRPAGVMCGVLDKVFLEFSFDETLESRAMTVGTGAADDTSQQLLERNVQSSSGDRWDPLVDMFIDQVPGDESRETWQSDIWQIPELHPLTKVGAAI